MDYPGYTKLSQFIDQVEIEVRSGDGGHGTVNWRREKYEPMGGPAGGNGGRGGSVYFLATKDLNTLVDFRFNRTFEADHGDKGGSKNRHGKAGKDLIIKVPIGTCIRDLSTQKIVADLTQDGQKVLIAEGGIGGKGNTELATATKRAPHYCEPGQPGIQRTLQLTLKLLADVGIVGLPNAGKSTLLAAVTRARPKIADYPFSTLEPNLGVVKLQNGDGFVLADVPGLIEGASEGIGLGHKFLQHLERTRLLIHMADITSETLHDDLVTIARELRLYSDLFANLPTRIKLPEIVYVISAGSRVNLDELISTCGHAISQIKALEAEAPDVPLEKDEAAYYHGESTYEIYRKKDVFYVEGDRPDRWVQVTDIKDPESLFALFQRLRNLGVIDDLISRGIELGQEVVVGGVMFTFGEDMT
ncbi:hypothetical protein Lal_00015728 [Lupinus albus]|nr:hypothetical protein Lal_00015728 [Lupinus albus]